MGKIEGVSLFQVRFNGRPKGFLAGVGKEILDNSSPLGCFFQRKKRLARDKTVINGLLPACAAFPLADNNTNTVVP
jgi:hypothetical protein